MHWCKSVKVGAPSGAAAYNVQGSTLHHLLRINVSRPEEKVTGTVLENLQERLKHLLCLIIDERSMLSSKALAAAERNVRHSVYKGQNGGEIWGGVLVVLLFGDDYQLYPQLQRAPRELPESSQSSQSEKMFNHNEDD